MLAHNAKRLKPDAHVIYNDWDNYAERLSNIQDTERLRQQIFNYLSDKPPSKRLTEPDKQAVMQIINDFDGFVDVSCLSAWLLFSGNQVGSLAELFDCDFYNTVRKSPYKTAEGYLDGLDIISESYTKLMPKYFDKPKTLFVLDPPYLHTGQGSYNQNKYFGMVDFLYLMSLTRPPYIFFSSTRTELLEYMDYLKLLDDEDWHRLGGYNKISINAYPNKSAMYEDNMIYRFV